MPPQLMAEISEGMKDLPQVGVAVSIVFLGLPLEHWVVVLTVIWAVIRLLMVAHEFYYKVKDRKYVESKRSQDGRTPRPARGDSHGDGADKDNH